MADLMTIRRNIIASNTKKPVPNVYGVEWNYADPSTVLTRTGAASGFANPIPAESLNEVGWSPFDNIYPWREMKRYNIINGEVAYSQDDAGYSETDYDTVVYIPEFYYYANKDTVNQKWNWSISATPVEGYKKHPGSGCYVGRFHTSGDSSAVYSKSGITPLNSITKADFRNYSKAKGSKWRQLDFRTWSAIQLLYLIEFANWNSQNVLGTGQTSGQLTATGETKNALYHTVKRNNSSNTYRWIENPYSNVRTFIDGIVLKSRTNNSFDMLYYITDDITKYNDDYNIMNTANGLVAQKGYISDIGYSASYPWGFLSIAGSGSESTYISDYVAISPNAYETKEIFIGGYYNTNNYFGMFYMYTNQTLSYTSKNVGSRLIYQ